MCKTHRGADIKQKLSIMKKINKIHVAVAVFLFLFCFILFCSAANAIEISLANFQNAAGKKNVLWNHLKIISACKIHPKKEIVDMNYFFFLFIPLY